jgi:phosphoserine phosphatase RsbX
MTLLYGAASRPKPGETENGDHYLTLDEGGRVTIAVADGLGHGRAAHEASFAACEFVRQNQNLGLERLIDQCGAALRNTRGAALTVLRVDKQNGALEYSAIGNVECLSRVRNGFRVVNAPGIVGVRVRKIMVFSARLSEGDLLAVCTDGISLRKLKLEDFNGMEPALMAGEILGRHAKEHDDATCLVLRY